MKMTEAKPLVELQTEIEKAEKKLNDMLPAYQQQCSEYGEAKKTLADLYAKRAELINSMFANHLS